jgi:hypothetical protein
VFTDLQPHNSNFIVNSIKTWDFNLTKSCFGDSRLLLTIIKNILWQINALQCLEILRSFLVWTVRMKITALLYYCMNSDRLLLLFMLMGWEYVSELRPSMGLLFISQMIYECGEPQWNDIDRGLTVYDLWMQPNPILAHESLTVLCWILVHLM